MKFKKRFQKNYKISSETTGYEFAYIRRPLDYNSQSSPRRLKGIILVATRPSTMSSDKKKQSNVSAKETPKMENLSSDEETKNETMCKRHLNKCDYETRANSKQTRQEEIQDADIDPPSKRTKLENPCTKDENTDAIFYSYNEDTDSEDDTEDDESFTDTESLFDNFDSLDSFSSLWLYYSYQNDSVLSDDYYENYFSSSSDSEDGSDDHDGDKKNGKKEQYKIVSGK